MKFYLYYKYLCLLIVVLEEGRGRLHLLLPWLRRLRLRSLLRILGLQGFVKETKHILFWAKTHRSGVRTAPLP